ncbi:DoxX family protein [Skermania sp. ID1734]|uniref:DoxX family protein n=1 Tax=Skermania sp. ID1734 TaxID=2597516 RepID=UPI00117FBB90|nr:DoxX family protein [Skermania sp. ID1734]TSE00693.1 DoxX family protein [Skermania sp. ID1734]
MDLGLFILRVLLGALLFGHSMQKLTGAFGGHGPAGTAPLFESWGLVPGKTMVRCAGLSELVAAVLLLLGLATPLGAAVAVGTMTVAASVNVSKGLWAVGGGYELPLVYGGIAGVLGFTGAGSWSVDKALGWSGGSVVAGVVALAVGLAAAAVVIGYARRNKNRARELAAA